MCVYVSCPSDFYSKYIYINHLFIPNSNLLFFYCLFSFFFSFFLLHIFYSYLLYSIIYQTILLYILHIYLLYLYSSSCCPAAYQLFISNIKITFCDSVLSLFFFHSPIIFHIARSQWEGHIIHYSLLIDHYYDYYYYFYYYYYSQTD